MTVRTGRTQSTGHRPLICQSCEARITFGNPLVSSTWYAQLRLTRDQFDLLLLAAAEFHAMTEGEPCGCPTPIEFVDWLGPDVLRSLINRDVRPRADGAPNVADGMYTHRHPDPVPVVTRSVRKLVA